MWPRCRAYSSMRCVRIHRRLTGSPLRRPRAGRSRSGQAVVSARVVAVRRAVVADGSLLIEQHYPQPVGLDLREVPDDAEQAHGRRRHGATGELLGVEAGDLQQHRLLGASEVVLEDSSFCTRGRTVYPVVRALGDDGDVAGGIAHAPNQPPGARGSRAESPVRRSLPRARPVPTAAATVDPAATRTDDPLPVGREGERADASPRRVSGDRTVSADRAGGEPKTARPTTDPGPSGRRRIVQLHASGRPVARCQELPPCQQLRR